MAFTAKFPGKCAGGDTIKAGEQIESTGRGYRHVGCRFNVATRWTPAYEKAANAEVDRAEAEHYRALDARDEQEYQAGLADGRRYQYEKAAYGPALAEAFAAQDEFNRYWKNGEDY